MQKKFFEAEQICRRTLKNINENPKVNDLIRAKTFCNYASALQAQKRNKESKMYFLKALKTYEENLFINDKTVADILYNLGKICKNATSSNQRKKAYQYFRRALEIQKSILDPMDLRLADVLVEISEDHNGDDDERESMLKQALEIHEYNEDFTSLQLGDLFFAAASNHIKLENENTETLYLKALKIYEAHQSVENCPSIYILLGDIYEIERKYDLAEFHYQKLLKIYESDNDELEQTGQALRLLVFVCKKQKKFDISLFYSFKALNLYEKEFRVYEFEISLIFSNIGSVYKKQGNFKEAIKYYEKTLEIEATNRPNHFRHANALKNLGIVNQNLKDYKEAVLCFLQSLEICKNKSEEEISAKVFYNLGMLFFIQKMYDSAERYLEEAIKLHEKNADWDYSVFCENKFAAVLQLYIKVLIKQQKYAKAEMYGLRVLEIEESKPETQAINTATACHLLAISCHYQKLYDEAKNYCNQALKLFDKVKSNIAEFEYAKLFATFGLIYTELADYDKAEMYFLNALMIFEFDNNTDKEDIAEIGRFMFQ
uniref:Tetratricopeptide repeat protein n=1 Tax=Panagrolaimus davidi TaxID=227884 RepID=A0A914PJN0_9BILA